MEMGRRDHRCLCVSQPSSPYNLLRSDVSVRSRARIFSATRAI